MSARRKGKRRLAGEMVTVSMVQMAHGGEALGRHEGKVIFVGYTLPGEVARVRLVEDHTTWARGQLVEVLSPSPDRVIPPCPYFGPERCGGCQWQHIAYERQLRLKQEIVVDQLRRLGRITDPPVKPTLAVGEPWGYRNHMQFSVTREGRLGLLRSHSRDVVAVDECLLLHPSLREIYASFELEWDALRRVILRCGVNTGERMVILEAESDEIPEVTVDMPVSVVLHRATKGPFPLAGLPFLREVVGGRTFRVSSDSFFQVNTAGAEALLGLVRTYLAPRGHETLLDLYCGVGLFGLSLAEEVGLVIGVDASESAMEDAAHNAAEMGLDNVALHEGPVEEVLPVLWEPAELAVLDPPRSGAGREVLKHLPRLHVRRLVYVSCDVATMARDARYLQELGYRLREVQPVDMFPQTYHVETVSLWEWAPDETPA